MPVRVEVNLSEQGCFVQGWWGRGAECSKAELCKAPHSREDGVCGSATLVQSAQGAFPLVALLCPDCTIPLRRLWAALRPDILYRQTILGEDVIPSLQLI